MVAGKKRYCPLSLIQPFLFTTQKDLSRDMNELFRNLQLKKSAKKLPKRVLLV